MHNSGPPGIIAAVVQGRRPPSSAAATPRALARGRSLAVLAALFSMLLLQPAAAQLVESGRGDLAGGGAQLGGFVLPVQPVKGDISLHAMRAWRWTVDDTKRLLLQGDVRIKVGNYSFVTDEATVWLNRLPSDEGLINQVAIFFDRINDPTAQAGVGVVGRGVLVTASARGTVTLDAALMQEGRPGGVALLARGEERLADYLRGLQTRSPQLLDRPQIEFPPPPAALPIPEPGRKPQFPVDEKLVEAAPPPPPPIFQPQGTVQFTAGSIQFEPGKHENVVTLTGGLTINYQSTPGGGAERWSQLTLTAERAVIFLDPGSVEQMARQRFDVSNIRGIYLEGDVVASADQGQYVVRAPKMYYDVKQDQAVMVDSIMRTYARPSGLPLYARATELRQVAANQWTADSMGVSTSEFFTPHLSVGVGRVVVTEQPGVPGQTSDRTYFDAHDPTIRIGKVPAVWWPRLRGEVRDIPLKKLQLGYREQDGVQIETGWDPISLFGLDRPAWVDRALIKADGFSKRGAGLGGELEYHYDGTTGLIDLYGMYDDGIDRTAAGLDVDPDRDTRGIASWEHTIRFDNEWMAQFQANKISDPTFINYWRPDDYAERREYETSFYVKRGSQNTSFTFESKYSLNDFISNEWLLVSRERTVDRAAEGVYQRFGDPLWGNRLSYSSEYRAGRIRFRFDDSTPSELGIPGAAFGITNNESLADSLFAQGYRTNYRLRYDTRQEISMPGQLGIFKVVPFLVGRVTGYDDDFKAFSSDTADVRLWGAAGLRVSTQFQRVSNGIENRLLDVHRLRHIIDPSVTLWYGATSLDSIDMPVYDQQVEALASGPAVKFGLRNTWQTQRGGPGRWQSVDWIVLDAGIVITGDDDDNVRVPVPQFFDYRPEYSQFGNHVPASLLWRLSDTLSITGSTIYDIDDDLFARGSIGTQLQHSPDFMTSVEYRYLENTNSQLLGVGWAYRFTKKYSMSLTPQWDFVAEKLRSINVGVTRSFPNFDLNLKFGYDDIQDEAQFSASLGQVEF